MVTQNSDLDNMLKEENFFEGYNDSIKQNFPKDEISFQQLTYMVFNTPHGKEWLKKITLSLFNELVDTHKQGATLRLAELQGEKNLVLKIQQYIASHQQYINANV